MKGVNSFGKFNNKYDVANRAEDLNLNWNLNKNFNSLQKSASVKRLSIFIFSKPNKLFQRKQRQDMILSMNLRKDLF